MGVGQLFKRMAYVQVVVGIIAYAVAEGSAALVLAGGTLSTLSWYIVEGPGGRPLPEWLLNLGVVAATGWLFYSQLPGSDQVLIYSLGQFLIFMQLFKLYERKGNRDWAQLMVLSLMQMICAMLVGASVLFGLLLVIYMGVTLFSVLLFQLKVGHDEVNQVNEKHAPPGYKAAPVPAISSRFFSRHFHGLAMVSGFGCLLVSAAIFLAMPRGAGAGMFGEWTNVGKKEKTGISSEGIKLNSSGQIELSSTPVLNLRVTANGRDIPPSEFEGTLLRRDVMDTYNPKVREWTRSKSVASADQQVARKKEPRPEGEPPAELTVPSQDMVDAPTLHQEITLRAPVKGALFAVYPPIRVDGRQIEKISFNAFDQILTTTQATGSDSQGFYVVESLLEDSDRLHAAYLRRWHPTGQSRLESWATYARGSMGLGEPRLTTLAQSILADSGLERDVKADSTFNDHALADAIVEYLQSKEEDYKYTTDLPPLSKTTDSTVAFLFENRRGHCEYFASAMCMLARELGLRARMARGLRVSEYNRVGGYYVVREKNMHAWVEVWQDGAGWKVYDPSPPAEIARAHRSGGLFSIFRNLYEYAEFKWIDKVITYDSTQRRSVMHSMEGNLKGVTEMLTKLKEQIDAILLAVQRRFLNDTFGFIVFVLAGMVVVMTMVVSLLILIQRRRAIQQLQLESVSRRMQRKLARHLEFYLHMLRVLEKAGFIKPLWQTPASFAAQLELQNAVRFAPVVPLTDLFYEIRFGGRPLDTDRAKTINGLLDSLRQNV